MQQESTMKSKPGSGTELSIDLVKEDQRPSGGGPPARGERGELHPCVPDWGEGAKMMKKMAPLSIRSSNSDHKMSHSSFLHGRKCEVSGGFGVLTPTKSKQAEDSTAAPHSGSPFMCTPSPPSPATSCQPLTSQGMYHIGVVWGGHSQL